MLLSESSSHNVGSSGGKWSKNNRNGNINHYEIKDCVEDFCSLTISSEYLEKLLKLVEKHRHKKVPVGGPRGSDLTIGGLEDTVLCGRKEMIEAWEELYLPESEKMVVIGNIENFPSLAEGLQLIIVVDSKGNVYAYENEVLHHVSTSVKDFFKSRGLYPPIRSYRKGESIEPMTEEEYLEFQKDPEIQEIQRRTREFIESKQKDFEEMLAYFER
ncbi:uncharacterized protein LOC136749913 [Amia ocellicauda]|uniref:uncharacterized protein LOC136749905 n=1 Tax=Amia ocellicauda TaxID=2972642 RepID=UPI0034643FC0